MKALLAAGWRLRRTRGWCIAPLLVVLALAVSQAGAQVGPGGDAPSSRGGTAPGECLTRPPGPPVRPHLRSFPR